MIDTWTYKHRNWSWKSISNRQHNFYLNFYFDFRFWKLWPASTPLCAHTCEQSLVLVESMEYMYEYGHIAGSWASKLNHFINGLKNKSQQMDSRSRTLHAMSFGEIQG